MWPFKKKTTVEESPITFESVICIPGNWQTDEEVKLAIVRATNGDYIAAGGVMMNAKQKCHFTFEVCERDPSMKQAFAVAGQVTGVSDHFLDEIDKHHLVVYLSGPTGSLTGAEQIVFAATALLKAGGIGVKIETAGKAFEKEHWLGLTNDFEAHHLYEMFVFDSLYMPDGTTFSCGMHNLGLKDTIVSGIPFQEAVNLIRIFGYYQVVDKPVILPNQTFTPTPDSCLFRITEEIDQPYKEDKFYGNPFGMWRLSET